jgi:hypothetical protein
VLSTEAFREFAREVVLYSNVMTRIEGRKHDELLLEKGGRGFPYVVAMDGTGAVLARLEDHSVDGFRAMMKSGAAHTALRGKADRTPAEEADVLAKDMAFGNVKGPEARTRIAALKGADEAMRKRLDGLLLDLDVQEVVRKNNGPDPALRVASGKIFAGYWKEGREPAFDSTAFMPFFVNLFEYAEAEKDVALFEKALERVKVLIAGNVRWASFVERMEGRLKALKDPPK